MTGFTVGTVMDGVEAFRVEAAGGIPLYLEEALG